MLVPGFGGVTAVTLYHVLPSQLRNPLEDKTQWYIPCQWHPDPVSSGVLLEAQAVKEIPRSYPKDEAKNLQRNVD